MASSWLLLGRKKGWWLDYVRVKIMASTPNSADFVCVWFVKMSLYMWSSRRHRLCFATSCKRRWILLCERFSGGGSHAHCEHCERFTCTMQIHRHGASPAIQLLLKSLTKNVGANPRMCTRPWCFYMLIMMVNTLVMFIIIKIAMASHFHHDLVFEPLCFVLFSNTMGPLVGHPYGWLMTTTFKQTMNGET